MCYSFFFTLVCISRWTSKSLSWDEINPRSKPEVMTLIIQEIEVTYFILNSLTYDLKKN